MKGNKKDKHEGIGRVAESVSGTPKIDTDYDATDRAIAEQAYHRSPFVLVIDDTETAGLQRRKNVGEDAEVRAARAARTEQGDFGARQEVGSSQTQ